MKLNLEQFYTMKYLKFKMKYLKLSELLGGAIPSELLRYAVAEFIKNMKETDNNKKLEGMKLFAGSIGVICANENYLTTAYRGTGDATLNDILGNDLQSKWNKFTNFATEIDTKKDYDDDTKSKLLAANIKLTEATTYVNSFDQQIKKAKQDIEEKRKSHKEARDNTKRLSTALLIKEAINNALAELEIATKNLDNIDKKKELAKQEEDKAKQEIEKIKQEFFSNQTPDVEHKFEIDQSNNMRYDTSIGGVDDQIYRGLEKAYNNANSRKEILIDALLKTSNQSFSLNKHKQFFKTTPLKQDSTEIDLSNILHLMIKCKLRTIVEARGVTNYLYKTIPYIIKPCYDILSVDTIARMNERKNATTTTIGIKKAEQIKDVKGKREDAIKTTAPTTGAKKYLKYKIKYYNLLDNII